MQLHVRGNGTHILDVDEGLCVRHVRELVCIKEELPLEEVRLYAGGVLLDDDCLPVSSLPCHGLDLTLPLRGGKVHGSLSRAGKVKGQTPKVDKAEKKKAKTGRAKRRIQYNRRFVNVVATFGKKKGPNSNS